MNQAETIHASWVKRDKMNMSRLDAAHTDARDNIQLEVEYKAYLSGASKGGTGPSIQEKRKKSTVEQFKRAKTLGEEINREDLREEDLAAPDTVIFEGHDSYDRHNTSDWYKRF